MKRSLRVGILILACFTAVLAIPDPEETVEEIEDGRSSLGAELRRQDGYTERAASGGNFVFFGSKRPRASAVRTSHDPYVAGDRTVHLKPTDNNGHYDHNLHTAYRLPLQRLSDKQLHALLKQYSPEDVTQHDEMSRVDMINKVQEQIAQRHQRKLIRPKLLTNINVLPEDVTIDSAPAIDPVKNERTTVGSVVATTTQVPRALPSITLRRPEIRRSQKQLPDIDDEEEPHHASTTSEDNSNESAGLRGISHNLERMKARYDSMRIQYLRRLRELNERKISLANPGLVNTPRRPLAPITADLPVVDNEFEPEESTTTTTTTEAPLETTTEKHGKGNSMINKLRNIVQKAMVYHHLLQANHKKTEEVTPSSVLHDAETEEHVAPREQQQPEKSLRSGAPRAVAIPRQYVAKTVVEPVQKPSFLHDGGAEEEEEKEEVTNAPVEVESVQNDEEVTTAPVLHEGGFKFNMKKVSSEISTADLISTLKDEYKNVHGTPILVDSDNESGPTEVQQDYEVTTTTELPEVFAEDLLTTLAAATEEVTETTPIPEVSVEASPASEDIVEETTTAEPEEESEPESKVITVDSEDQLDLFAESDEEAICDAIACTFEKGDLCQWEASAEEVSLGSPHYRVHRGAHYVRRTWHNWRGLYRNRVTGIARAQVFSFENERFAASYVRPFQRSTLSAKLLSGESDTIRFRAWEATRNVQLRVCCDTTDNCVFETDLGVMRGSRQWREYKATCPKGSSKIIFECINTGVYQGACGVDNIYLVNEYCPALIPNQYLLDSGELRRHRKH
uniref:Mucin-5AC n=1 Tax=Panagrellus redivivus TaxID=6233 RepID=A0A7E4ZVJ2_PANRE